MQPLGRHELVELYGCDPAVLDDVERLRTCLLAAARAAGCTIIDERLHAFAPHGVSGVVILSESHLALHTWPEHRYAAVDLFTCHTAVDAAACFALLGRALAAERQTSTVIARGLPAELERHRRPPDER